MSFKTIVNNSRLVGMRPAHGPTAFRFWPMRVRWPALAVLLGAGLLLGAGGRSAAGMAEVAAAGQAERAEAELDQVRRGAQQEVNAMAARLGELQAQANRLNALGERLTRPASCRTASSTSTSRSARAAPSPPSDMPPPTCAGVDELEQQFAASGTPAVGAGERCCSTAPWTATPLPSRMPIANSYITSGFGGRADPFGGGHQFHKGIDFEAASATRCWPWPMAWSASPACKSGYGNVVEVDHGNGYVTRYAHNSRLGAAATWSAWARKSPRPAPPAAPPVRTCTSRCGRTARGQPAQVPGRRPAARTGGFKRGHRVGQLDARGGGIACGPVPARGLKRGLDAGALNAAGAPSYNSGVANRAQCARFVFGAPSRGPTAAAPRASIPNRFPT
jgi:hypothetical protein